MADNHDNLRRGRATAAARSCLSVTELVAESTFDVPAASEAAIRDRALEMPIRCVRTYLRAMRGKSMQSGVRAFCSMCMGWEDHRKAIPACTDPACPLYPYRPYQN